MEKTKTNLGAKRRTEELKDIKVSPSCKDALKNAKLPGETYSEMFFRLLTERKGEKEGEKGEIVKAKGEKEGEKKESDNSIITELNSFGLTPERITQMVEASLTNERLRLRRPYGKPLDITKIARIAIISITTTAIILLLSPSIIALLSEVL